jgi:hypothetical protein
MKIIREYEMETANYAMVVLEDGSMIELKIQKKSKENPSVDDWESLAKSLPEDSEISEPSTPTAPTAPKIQVFQDGEKIYG